MSQRKVGRRLDLLDDCLDALLRTSCRFVPCPGPLAPVRHGLTCFRCYCIHRAIKQGMIRINKARPGNYTWDQTPAVKTLAQDKEI